MKYKERYIECSGLKFHVLVAGPETGVPVLLLHGFPDVCFGWEAQLQALTEAGYYAIAIDQRGYNLSAKPRGVYNYTIDKLAADVLRVADALKIDRFNLVGHDFGAMVSWYLAIRYPQRLRHMIISNVPHPFVLHKFLRTNPAQMLKSSYIAFFQLPVLPEVLLRINNWKPLVSQLSGKLNQEQRARYRAAWTQPGAITTMLNWYRAFAAVTTGKEGNHITVPTRIIWGKHDPYLLHEMAQESMQYLTHGDLATLDEAGHWVQHDEASRFNALMLEHFAD